MRCLVIFSIVFILGTSVFGRESGKGNLESEQKKQLQHVTFSIKKGAGGCAHCETSIAEMLKDPKMKAELTKLFPENSSVIFYIRKHKENTVIPENAIAIVVGNCAGSLKAKGKVFISGCGRKINKDVIYTKIIAEFAKKKEKY
jgi:hypothetical protein